MSRVTKYVAQIRINKENIIKIRHFNYLYPCFSHGFKIIIIINFAIIKNV